MSFPSRGQVPWVAEGFQERLGRAGLTDLGALSERGFGAPVTDHRSSWVQTTTVTAEHCYIKTYDYPDRRSRRRGVLRNTWLAKSRAHREALALAWLRGAGFAAPEPLLAWEDRRSGWLHRAVLVTGAWPGQDLDTLLPELAPGAATPLLASLEEQLDRLHRAGFRHRNLDPRNILARSEGHRSEENRPEGKPTDAGVSWQVAFLDAPRFKLRRPTPVFRPAPPDRLARGDHQRLAVGLRKHGMPWPPEPP